MEEKKDYQDAYEKEHYKAVYLANRVAELEDQVDDLQFKLNRIKNNPIWKASGPARKCMHFVIRQKDRLKNCGSLSGVIAKVRYKSWEKKAMTHYGTQSFPSAEERQKQEAAVFERMPKISILVPLWNTPESFLTEMIGSVQWQTYKNWELCLADGSDDAHAYVGEYCKRLAAQDSRIVYQKLAKNEGISGNTNECYKLASGEFIGLFDHDDILHPCALYEYVKAINEKDADFIYCDEATFKSPDINKMITMHFKPDYAIDNLRANNYICHFSVFSRELLDGTELFRTKFDGSQDHDMILRLTDNAKHIVMCRNFCIIGAPMQAVLRAISRQSLTWSKRREARLRIICADTASKTLQLRALVRLRRFLKSVMKLSGNRRFLSLFRIRIMWKTCAAVSAPLWKNRPGKITRSL